jgi:hypothetical protein
MCHRATPPACFDSAAVIGIAKSSFPIAQRLQNIGNCGPGKPRALALPEFNGFRTGRRHDDLLVGTAQPSAGWRFDRRVHL